MTGGHGSQGVAGGSAGGAAPSGGGSQATGMRVGVGFDAHRFAADRSLVLGGVRIRQRNGLLGHSDADVLTHAIMDALLGAAGLDDIGELFPDNDPAFAGADSIGLLRNVVETVGRRGWRIVNVDAVVVCEEPRISPHRAAMRERLGMAMGVGSDRVTVRGTTTEGLGFTGRKEGIAAQAVALLEGTTP